MVARHCSQEDLFTIWIMEFDGQVARARQPRHVTGGKELELRPLDIYLQQVHLLPIKLVKNCFETEGRHIGLFIIAAHTHLIRPFLAVAKMATIDAEPLVAWPDGGLKDPSTLSKRLQVFSQ